nr:hypothetical protein [Tanacetum cinerariifolium]
MTLFGYRLNPRYAIKECPSCETLYTRDCSCSKGNVEDKILVPKPPKNYARCGHPVNGPYCQGSTLLREKLKEDLVTYFQSFQNTSESSDGSTNVVNAPREPFVVKRDHDENPPHIDECCCECGEALDGIICQQCALPCISKPNFVDDSSNIFNPPPQPPIHSCEFCESNAQYGHYCTPQAPFINPEPGYSQDFNFPQDIHDFQQHPGWNRPAVYDDDDDDVDYTIRIIPVLSTKEPDNSLTKDHFEIVINSNDDYSSSYDDSLYYENIEYVEASPHDSELVSLKVEKIVILKDEEIEDDNLREKLLKVNLLIAKIEALREISSGSTTTHSDISLPEYDSFIFDLSNDQFPLIDRSDLTHEEFCDEPAYIISPSEYDCFYFRNLPDPVEDDYSPLLAYVLWIFLAYLTYPVIPPRLYLFRNEDTIFDPGITINRSYSFKTGLSHRCGTFKKFNTHRSHLNESPTEMLFSTLFPMDQ